MVEEKGRVLKEKSLKKTPTGISGLDDITYGGLPEGRTTLVYGSAGSGKTLMAMEFLVKGAENYGEPGVFMAFEETAEDLAENFASMGFDLDSLEARNKLIVDYVRIEKSEIEETGEYDLEGLFIRLGLAIDSIGAKRVALDTLEVLFSGFQNEAILRSELRRLFRWLKDRGVTAIVTGERGETSLTRYGLEEYVADCVIFLDNRMEEQIATRRLRIIKYRGSKHGTNEYPFMIEEDGMSVLPITSLGLEHEASRERISTGIPRLDTMLGGQGYYRGTTILISGTAGSGKTSFAAQFCKAACEREESCLYFAYEESPDQIIRNMRSIGIDLKPYLDSGLLKIHASRPMAYGLEMHLITMRKFLDTFKPNVVVIDPISNLTNVGTQTDVRLMLTRFIDYLKLRNITAVCTSLVEHESTAGINAEGISSLMDTWVNLRFFENSNERNRGISVIKSRGMGHSNQIREYLLTDHGIEIQDVYLGPSGDLLMGSSKAVQEAEELAESVAQRQNADRKKRELETRLKSLDTQIASLNSEYETLKEELDRLVSDQQLRNEALATGRSELVRIRKADKP
ncbi:circadian clock protein KaiC [Methanosarcina mazei]|uniref:non-specific serine/threonine protein kinase n=1 Tax=Methanosarcina mazei TaxID=2209 RepID=A0A0F8F2Q0_METMZ|nr:circadian clock protein KaiC [Methanosarcina mazei]KKG35398.1 KaiC 1 [Methanosarcina mazei]KKG36524.1 KaiC 1 [Methanosarcina mazei]KKG59342.1 KaiC 1 [Methanosarcina mazei]KKH31422.1 KaiC 1 [Methanosarcina mazei]QCR16336.1 KaiC 1 [Methanosarcina mazei]